MTGCAELVGDFGERVAGSGRAFPVLLPAGDGEIVPSHGAINMQDGEAECGDAAA